MLNFVLFIFSAIFWINNSYYQGNSSFKIIKSSKYGEFFYDFYYFFFMWKKLEQLLVITFEWDKSDRWRNLYVHNNVHDAFHNFWKSFPIRWLFYFMNKKIFHPFHLLKMSFCNWIFHLTSFFCVEKQKIWYITHNFPLHYR